jgi:hypothetical protein
MSRSGRVLVYCDSRALNEAARLLPRETCLENAVTRWIRAGLVVGERRRGGPFVVRSEDGRLEATVTREPGRIRPRPRSWVVHSVRRRAPSSQTPSKEEAAMRPEDPELEVSVEHEADGWDEPAEELSDDEEPAEGPADEVVSGWITGLVAGAHHPEEEEE